eukprot:356661-Chlamydomonas_euryale.AAC.6
MAFTQHCTALQLSYACHQHGTEQLYGFAMLPYSCAAQSCIARAQNHTAVRLSRALRAHRTTQLCGSVVLCARTEPHSCAAQSCFAHAQNHTAVRFNRALRADRTTQLCGSCAVAVRFNHAWRDSRCAAAAGARMPFLRRGAENARWRVAVRGEYRPRGIKRTPQHSGLLSLGSGPPTSQPTVAGMQAAFIWECRAVQMGILYRKG